MSDNENIEMELNNEDIPKENNNDNLKDVVLNAFNFFGEYYKLKTEYLQKKINLLPGEGRKRGRPANSFTPSKKQKIDLTEAMTDKELTDFIKETCEKYNYSGDYINREKLLSVDDLHRYIKLHKFEEPKFNSVSKLVRYIAEQINYSFEVEKILDHKYVKPENNLESGWLFQVRYKYFSDKDKEFLKFEEMGDCLELLFEYTKNNFIPGIDELMKKNYGDLLEKKKNGKTE